MDELTHLNEKGEAHMVDVSPKAETLREATATGRVTMKPETLKLIKNQTLKKGDVLSVARIAGMMAAKKTPELIPLCHAIMLDQVNLEFEFSGDCAIDIEARVKCIDRTGVEMEAMTAVSVAALAIYDMCKAVDRGVLISDICLQKKSGGKSGTFIRSGDDR
ncbi:MAG: cyclic pyranopterin monophosphate synthase MoaC [Dehalococcoidales bacterium]